LKHQVTEGGLFLERVGLEGGRIYRELVQPSRELILQHNAHARAAGGPSDLSFGRLQLRIPLEDLAQLYLLNPELNSPDAQIMTQAWRRFVASPESLPYRVGKT
jgi:hypothetical protein